MRTKLTPKQEKFCNNIAKGMNPSEAYRDAYKPQTTNINTIKGAAQRELRKSYISTTIQEKQLKNQQEVVYTARDSFNSLLYAQQMAEEQKNLPAWLKAEELKGKLLGLYTEKIKAEVESKSVQIIFDTRVKGI